MMAVLMSHDEDWSQTLAYYGISRRAKQQSDSAGCTDHEDV